MLQKNETLSPPEGPLTDAPPPEAVSAATKRPTRWPWIVGAAVVVVLAAAAVMWLLGSTVSQDRYDETVAELTASEEALAASEAALADAQDDAAELQSQVDGLSQEIDELSSAGTAQSDQVAELEALSEELQNRIASARALAQFMAYRSLDFLAEDIAAMQEVGDTATADAVLRQLGETGTWIEWVDAGGWLNVGNSVAEIDDAALSAAWTRWLDTEIGSVEEMTAYAELEQRLAYLMLDALAEG